MSGGRKYWLLLTLALAPLVGKAERDLKVTIFVYNYAGAPAEVLAQAEALSAQIYSHGGIGIDWLDCPLSPQQAAEYPRCQVAPTPTRLAIRIVPRVMAERYRQAEHTFGFAQHPLDGSFGMVATVFFSDAEDVAKRRGVAVGVLLGHLMAHELGHLLLGAGSHSAEGIMHVPWQRKELEAIAAGLMLFTISEEERLRAGVRARVASEQATSLSSNKN